LLVASSYPFLNLMWTILIVFLWICWLMLLFYVFADVFRRHDTSGFVKALWLIFVIVAPFLGVLIYVIANGSGMAERNMKQQQAQQEQFDAYVKTVAADSGGGAAAEIEKAKGLLDSGAISQAEYDTIKAKALA
jgi:predicted PurR-regulated permease PerM